MKEKRQTRKLNLKSLTKKRFSQPEPRGTEKEDNNKREESEKNNIAI